MSQFISGVRVIMVDENINTSVSGNQSELPTPKFDEHASAKAQPVTPITKSRVTIFVEKASQLFTSGPRSLALVVALGIATGALAGMAIVKDGPSSLPGPEEQASVLRDVDRPETLDLQDAEVGVYGFQNSASRTRGPIIRRSRVQSDGQPRAYRFAVIR